MKTRQVPYQVVMPKSVKNLMHPKKNPTIIPQFRRSHTKDCQTAANHQVRIDVKKIPKRQVGRNWMFHLRKIAFAVHPMPQIMWLHGNTKDLVYTNYCFYLD